MYHLKSFFLTIAAIAAFGAMSIALPGDAVAQMEDPPCTSDSDCNTTAGEVCYNGSCKVLVCSAHDPSDELPDHSEVFARFDSWPGDAITVIGAEQETPSTSTCTVGAPNCDTMEYVSRYAPSLGACGDGVFTDPCPGGSTSCGWSGTGEGGWGFNCWHSCDLGPHEFRHQGLVKSGKYMVHDTGERCAATGAYIVRLDYCFQ